MGKGYIKTIIVILLTFCFVFAEGSRSTVTIMKDTRFGTEAHMADSGINGLTVIIIGGIHGDETAGVLAAEALSRLIPLKGKIVVVPRANKPACENGVRTEYYMEDLNRCFPGDKGGSLSSYAAAMLVEAISGYNPAVVIDLHESKEKYGEEPAALGQALVISETGDSAKIVLDILERLNEKVGAGNEFTFASGAPEGSMNREISKLLSVPAVTVETWSGQSLEDRVEQQIWAVSAILRYFEMSN